MTNMNNNKYNETKKKFENSKLEDEKTYQELSKTIDDNIEVISKMNASNCEDILVNMYENYYEVFALDNNIDELNNLNKELNEAKNSLINKQNITFDDILNEISDKIMTIYLLSCLGISITTTDALDFLKKYLIIGIIGLTSFDLNRRYFTSNFHKKKLASEVKEYDLSIESNEYTIEMLKKYRSLFQKQIDFERDKLNEVLPKTIVNESLEDYIKRVFPSVTNVEFIPVDNNDKTLTKKK